MNDLSGLLLTSRQTPESSSTGSLWLRACSGDFPRNCKNMSIAVLCFLSNRSSLENISECLTLAQRTCRAELAGANVTNLFYNLGGSVIIVSRACSEWDIISAILYIQWALASSSLFCKTLTPLFIYQLSELSSNPKYETALFSYSFNH